MVFYKSKLAKMLLPDNSKDDYITLFGFSFTRKGYFMSIWEGVEMQIHRRQYAECFVLAVIPTILLCIFISCIFIALPFISYYILYWIEMVIYHHSAFDYEAKANCMETTYFIVHKRFAWMKWYCKKELPKIDNDWLE